MSCSKYKSIDDSSDDYSNSRNSKTLPLRRYYEKYQDDHKDKFKEEVREIERLYEAYYIQPERYPKYREEWANFYDVRSEQAYKKGFNLRYYDFTKEWRSYKSRDHENTFSSSTFNNFGTSPKFGDHSNASSKRHKRNHKDPTVISVCQELVDLGDSVSIEYFKITDLFTKALLHERLNKEEEYLMTQQESVLMRSSLEILQKSLWSKNISERVLQSIRKAISNLEQVLMHWNETSIKHSSRSSSPSPKRKEVHKKQDKKDMPDDLKRALEKLEASKTKIKKEPQEIVIKAEPEEREPVERKPEISFLISIQSEATGNILQQTEHEIALLEQRIQESGRSGSNKEVSNKLFMELFEYRKNREKIISNAAKNITEDELTDHLQNFGRLSHDKQKLIEKILTIIEKTEGIRYNRLKKYK